MATLLERRGSLESLIHVNTPTPNPGHQAAIRLLLIEDNPDDAFLLRQLLRNAPIPFEIEEAPLLAAGLERLDPRRDRSGDERSLFARRKRDRYLSSVGGPSCAHTDHRAEWSPR